ncbi:tripartite tricarboxylate transporter substrate-binding protein [Muricoccus radiodurans]|uniref:tripartite tricarboxylate transporter substrate-binding protein n=1 Tax=Muricoccus radiodurans TaxID=2231721 RepID=UPI003CF9761D
MLTAAALASLAAPALAQQAESWPNRPVRIVVPFVPGGPTDVSVRIVAEQLRQRLGQPFVIENRGGAGGLLGAQLVAQAAPDGYTLLYTSSSVAIGPSLQPGLGFDPLRDLAPVSLVTDVATTLVVRPDAPMGSIADLVSRAKASPGSLSYGTSGVGSSNHLTAALLAFTAGIELLHVPFRGTTQATAALFGHNIDMVFASTAETLAHYRDGKVRVLGVATASRLPEMPDVPTIGETLPGYVAPNWFALFGPAAISPVIVGRLEAELSAIGRLSAVRDQFATLGITPLMSNASTMRARMAEDVPTWRRVVQQAGIRAE